MNFVWHHNPLKTQNAKVNPVKELTVAEISELLGFDVKVVK